jgi:hypothetical protein
MIEATTLNPKTEQAILGFEIWWRKRVDSGLQFWAIVYLDLCECSQLEGGYVMLNRGGGGGGIFGVERGFRDAEGGSRRSIVRAVEMVPNVHRNLILMLYTWHVVTRAFRHLL